MATLALLQPSTTLKPDDLSSVSPTFSPMGMTWNASDVVVSDIEGDNLLYGITTVHCGVILNPFTLEEYVYEPSQVQEYLAQLSRSSVVVGHNFRGFDLLALAKLHRYRYPGFCFDTLILSRLLDPERLRHSLEGWGKQLKFYKGEYKDAFKEKCKKDGIKYVDGMEWREFSQEMFDYCVQDVRLNAVVFLYMILRLGWWDWFGTTEAACKESMRAIRAGDIRRM